jgi:hypothetical protein
LIFFAFFAIVSLLFYRGDRFLRQAQDERSW